MYTKSFYLKGQRGNNAFAYSVRGPEPKLYVPSIHTGQLKDVQVGNEAVFEDFDYEGEFQSCKGLKNFIRAEWKGIPLLVVDNHNHVFYFWYEALEKAQVQRNATLIHIDAHKDARVPEAFFPGGTLEEVFRYTNEDLNVGNYIIPAQKEGLVGEVQFVTSEEALSDTRFMQTKNKILNIDLDFFASDMSYIDFARAKAFILEQAKSANLITVATSPFFIDQNLAIKILLELFAE